MPHTSHLNPTVALVAGETSGDILGAGLIRSLKAQRPELKVVGVGGPRMVDAGLEQWADCDELAVMGLAEVLRDLPRLLRLRRWLREQIIAHNTRLFIGIDAPDFNLGLARSLRPVGISCLHYVSPSIWAWRQGRARKIGRCVDEVLTLFPFEPDIYRQHGVAARFVGHPTADAMPEEPDRVALRTRLGLPEKGRVLAVLPGSRRGEVERLASVFAEGCAHLMARVKGLTVVVPVAAERLREPIKRAFDTLPDAHQVHFVDGRGAEVLAAADVALVASGTAALEAMFAKVPTVVGYRIASLTHFIVMRFGLMKSRRYALPNVLAGEDLMPELMQDDLRPGRIADEIGRLLRDHERAAHLRTTMIRIHRELAVGADRRAAAAALEYLS